MKCIRCRCEFDPPKPESARITILVPPNVCGSCADDLRSEENAHTEVLKAEAADIEFQMNKEAYEDTLAGERFDRPQGG